MGGGRSVRIGGFKLSEKDVIVGKMFHKAIHVLPDLLRLPHRLFSSSTVTNKNNKNADCNSMCIHYCVWAWNLHHKGCPIY